MDLKLRLNQRNIQILFLIISKIMSIKIFLYFSILLSASVQFSCNSKQPVSKPKSSLDLDSLLKKHPNNVSLLIKRGNRFLHAYNYDKALSDGAKAFRLANSNFNAKFLYANALNNRAQRSISDVDQAKNLFLSLLKVQPGNKEVYVALASTYTHQGDFENSFRYINQALKIDKRYRDAYVLKGTNYLSLGNRKLAKSSYETAIQQDPSFYEGYLQLGFMYSEDNDPLSIEYFKSAATLKPNSVDALYGVGYSLQQQLRFSEAQAAYRHLLDVDPQFYLALFNQGYIKQFELNELDSAAFFYKSALQLQPSFVKAWHNLGLCFASQGRKVDAYKAFSKALKYNPDFEISRIEASKLK